MEEPSEPMNNDVDVNVLVNVYNQRIAQLTNQNIYLEARITSLTKDFQEEKDLLLKANLEMQKQIDKLPKPKRKPKVVDKYQEDTKFDE